MENNGIVKSLADYLMSVKLNAVLPPNLMKLEPRNGFSKDQELEVKVFDPTTGNADSRTFELQVCLECHTAAELHLLEGKRIKLTPSGAGSSYEAKINKRGFAEFKDIPSAYYSLELKS